MNLHLCYDEKIITRTIKYFEEALPGQNRFIIIANKGKDGCSYVQVDEPYVFFEKYGTRSFWAIVGEVNQYSNIIIHYLGNEMCRFVISLPNNAPVTWIIWGADLYNGLLARKGYRLLANPEEKLPRTIFGTLKYYGLRPLKKILDYYNYRNRVRAIRKIRSVTADKGDLQLLYQYYPEVEPYNVKDFFYYPIDDIIGDKLKEVKSEGNDIIVGNSASYTNNHRFVFNILKDIDLGERKVIVPLSYGGNAYAAVEAGQQLGEHFQPILDFMPLSDYNKMLVSASTFVYGNFRQEAVGNILIALYLGAVVFLYDKNPLYDDLLEMGYIVYPISQLKEKINYKLTEEELRHNRELVFKLNNRELLLSYIKKSFGDDGRVN